MNLPELGQMSPILLTLFSFSVFFAVLTTFSRTLRSAVIYSWFSALSLGGVFLICGSEVLALAQWGMSTLVAISLLYYVLLSGRDRETIHPKRAFFGLFVGAGWIFVLLLALPGEVTGVSTDGVLSLVKIGQGWAHEHFLSAVLLGFLILVLVIGVGDFSRAEEPRP